MGKLLSASFFRLWKNKVFWGQMGFAAAGALLVCMANYSPAVQAGEHRLYLEDVFFVLYQVMGFLLAAGISLIVGTEYSDGTIRNKLMVGYTRAQIYFSGLIASAVSSCLVLLIHGVVTSAAGGLLFGGFRIPTEDVVFSLLCALLTALVYSALFVLIAMNCSSRSATAVISLLLALGLLYATSYLGAAVMEPEMTYASVTFTQDGVQYSGLIDNPNYISGARRTVYEFLYDLLPTGQLTQMYYQDFARSARWPWLSLGLLASASALGYGLFRRKDVK